MKRLLHIVASPRGEESRTLQISGAFLDAFRKKHPDWVIDELDLGKETLPSMTAKQVGGKYVLLSGKDLFGRLREAWVEILQHIDRFKTADLYLISSPMWNFSIPYMLKQYIDLIVQPRHLFAYDENKVPHGLLENKKMAVIATRGGEYVKDTAAFDFQEPYLRTIFGFVGIQDITFIKAEPMDMGHEVQKAKIHEAKQRAVKLAGELDV
jgi:FMN-dependent NADH-azoreductase